MKWSKFTIGAAALACLSASGVAFAQQADRPTFLPDGAVRVPSFELPPSSFMSPEAIEEQKAREKSSGNPAMAGGGIAEMRAAVERQLAPQVAASRQRYAVDIAPKEIAGVKTQIITPTGGEADRSRVLINLHGGAFSMCAQACALVESIPVAAVGRFKVITVDYRQAPEHKFPAATEDVVAVYRDLLKTYRPEKIGIYGCSAGGALTAQVAAWLVDKKLPVPGGLGIFGAGAARFGAGDSAYIAGYIDGSFPPPQRNGQTTPLSNYFDGADGNSALVSPAGHPDVLAKFPPTLFITGTRSMDMSPAIYTHSQLLKAGARSALLVGEGMGHCYIYKSALPEARDAYDVIVKFFNENLGKKTKGM